MGDTITVTCLARGSEILEDHWKYPGKLVRAHENELITCFGVKSSQKSYRKGWFETQSSWCFFFVWQANRAIKTVHENKRAQEILYTLTIPQASTKDSGIYSCSITDIISNEDQTKEIAVQVFGMKAVFR